MPLTLTVSESGGYDLKPEDEWLDGTITSIEEYDGQWGPALKWIIEIDGDTADDGSQIETFAFCSQKLTPRSTLYRWAKGLDWDPDDGTLDLEQFIGTRVQAMFEHKDSTDEDGNPITRDRVAKLRKGKGKAKKAAKKPVDDDPEAPF